MTTNFILKKLIHCKSFYIGKTERVLGNRLKEHCRKPTAKTPNTNAPFKHSDQTGHTIDYEEIEILVSSDSNFKLCIKETSHGLIRKDKFPCLIL